MRSLTPAPPADDDAALASALDAALLGREAGLPGPDRSAELRARVLEAVAADSEATAAAPTGLGSTRAAADARPQRGSRWLAAAAVGAVLATGAVAVPGSVAEAHAEQVLTRTAEGITFTDDLVPGPGQYLRVDYRMEQTSAARWGGGGPQALAYGRSRYIPADSDAMVVDVPTPTDMSDGSTRQAPSEAYPAGSMEIHALPGQLGVEHLDDVPRDRDALLQFFRDRYAGGSVSRDENLFVQLTDTLRTPGLPADLRSALVSVLAQAPGVRIEEGVTLRDGRTGIAVGRAEPLRMGSLERVVLDPATGQVIGEQAFAGVQIGGFRIAELIDESTTRLSVVDEAPTPDRVAALETDDDHLP